MILTKITTLEFSVLTSVEASPELSLTSRLSEVGVANLGGSLQDWNLLSLVK